MPRKSKQQTCTDNESQEDILRDGYRKDVLGGNEVNIISDAGLLSQKGSFGSDCPNIPPVSRKEF
jgi:hypothetical protein